jgi:hypothetical protein
MVLTSYVAAAVAVVCDAVPVAVLPNELGLSELYKLHVQVINGGQKLMSFNCNKYGNSDI